MAGSYNHIVYDPLKNYDAPSPEALISGEKEAGDLVTPEDFQGMIENLGDAYEMAEELYGMIWLMAHTMAEHPQLKLNGTHGTAAEYVEFFRTQHDLGLSLRLDRDLTKVRK